MCIETDIFVKRALDSFVILDDPELNQCVLSLIPEAVFLLNGLCQLHHDLMIINYAL